MLNTSTLLLYRMLKYNIYIYSLHLIYFKSYLSSISIICYRHRGVLVRTSSDAALTGEVLFYPPNLVRPAISRKNATEFRSLKNGTSEDDKTQAPLILETAETPEKPSEEVVKEKELVPTSPPSPERSPTDKQQEEGPSVVTLKPFKASKPTQMSFMRGDIIRVVNATGKWSGLTP